MALKLNLDEVSRVRVRERVGGGGRINTHTSYKVYEYLLQFSNLLSCTAVPEVHCVVYTRWFVGVVYTNEEEIMER